MFFYKSHFLSDTLIVAKPESFNELALRESGINVLKVNVFYCDKSTNHGFKDRFRQFKEMSFFIVKIFLLRIKSLETSINEPIADRHDSIRRRQMLDTNLRFEYKFLFVVFSFLFRGYAARKSGFEHDQEIEYFEKKKRLDRELCNELRQARKNVGYNSDTDNSSDSDSEEPDPVR